MSNFFLSKPLKPSDLYPINFSRNNDTLPAFKLTKSKYRITIRTTKLGNNISSKEEKLVENPAVLEQLHRLS